MYERFINAINYHSYNYYFTELTSLLFWPPCEADQSEFWIVDVASCFNTICWCCNDVVLAYGHGWNRSLHQQHFLSVNEKARMPLSCGSSKLDMWLSQAICQRGDLPLLFLCLWTSLVSLKKMLLLQPQIISEF